MEGISWNPPEGLTRPKSDGWGCCAGSAAAKSMIEEKSIEAKSMMWFKSIINKKSQDIYIPYKPML